MAHGDPTQAWLFKLAQTKAPFGKPFQASVNIPQKTVSFSGTFATFLALSSTETL
jgi:hypothetical protein